MTAAQLINEIIPPLKKKDHAYQAMRWMEELRLDQLPVTENGQFLGFLTDEILWDENDLDRNIDAFELIGQPCYVQSNQHLYDIMKAANEHQLNLIAVTNEHMEYLGVISLNETIVALSQSISVQSPGGILTLSMRMVDYSMAEISRIVEAEEVKILSSWVNIDENNPESITLTIKFDTINLSRVIASLERFDYRIIAKYHESPDKPKDKENYDILMKFINM